MTAEKLDATIRREARAPLQEERDEYARIVNELERRGQHQVLPYYRERLLTIYQPTRKTQ